MAGKFGFCCPNCGQLLTVEEKRLVCPRGHSFDRAKEGYVNLLLPGGKHSKVPGDNRQMVQARRAFLEHGYYAPLADALAARMAKDLPAGARVLDAGCGEGYYTGRVREALHDPHMLGVDISKFALRAAAKKDRSILYAVASVFHLPVADASVDAVMTLFAPYCGSEYVRILRPGGLLYRVIPDRDHLWELKQMVYDHPYENEVQDFALEGFTFLEALPVRTMLDLLSAEDIRHLFDMTPYAYKTSQENAARLYALETLQTRASFLILCYQRKN